ncbi:hypothetical protein [Metarhizobium album]|uniref:hypothetical protein n=1 Tax=Metarhizobium album TaxID=2182425 RepID=UPI001FDF11FB|nr:hypothetical protein [Rhizobium album]
MMKDTRLVEAGNVLQAVAVLGRNPPFDFLITDVDMPGHLTGLDLAAMVADFAPSTKTIVTSGRRIGREPLNDWRFLPKPYGIDRILEILDGEAFEVGVAAQAVKAL